MELINLLNTPVPPFKEGLEIVLGREIAEARKIGTPYARIARELGISVARVKRLEGLAHRPLPPAVGNYIYHLVTLYPWSSK